LAVNFPVDALSDASELASVEFGVGLEGGDEQFGLVPTDVRVKQDLADMAAATIGAVGGDEQPWDPAEKYGPTEPVWVARDDPLAEGIVAIADGQHDIVPTGLDDPQAVFCYFARFRTADGTELTGVRRAMQFKSVARAKLLRVIDDSVHRVEDRIFKLDGDFDLLVDTERVHIWRPAAFEFLGNLQQTVLAAVPGNVAAIQADVPFVDFGPVEAYAASHPRAARLLAAIRTQGNATGIDRSKLVRLCRSSNVSVNSVRGRLTVGPGDVLGFLEILDRRRYDLELVVGTPERYRAASRARLH